MIQSQLDKTSKNQELNNFQKLLADPTEAKYISMAKKISPQGKVVKRETDLGIKLTKDMYANMYNPTFTIQEIKAECLKFNRSFVRAKEYKGDLTSDLMRKVETFLEKNPGLVMADYDYGIKLFVMAPMDNKTTINSPITNHKDPLFFVETERNEYYTLIDGEKTYVNLFNRWKGFKMRSLWNCRWGYTIEHAIILIMLSVLAAYHGIVISFWGLILLFPLAIITASLRMCCRKSFQEPFSHEDNMYNNDKFKYFPTC